MTLKTCSFCREEKELSEFHKDKRGSFGRAYYCRECANQKTREFHLKYKGNKEYRDKRRNNYYRMTYGLTSNEVKEVYKEQDNKCGICKKSVDFEDQNSHLDHCHASNKIRGVLCTNCNRGIGHLQEDVNIMKRAIEWVKKDEP